MTILRVPVLIQAASLRSAETGTLSFTKQIKYVFRNSTPKKDLTKAKIFSEEEPQRNKPGSLRPANCRKAKLTATSETAAFALTRLQIAAVFFRLCIVCVCFSSCSSLFGRLSLAQASRK